MEYDSPIFISDQTDYGGEAREKEAFFSFCLLNGLCTTTTTDCVYYGRDALQLQYSVDTKNLSKSQARALTLAMGFPSLSLLLLNVIKCAID